MMDTILTSPLHDPLPILILADQAGQILQYPHPRVALPGAPASGHLLVLKMKPLSSQGCGYSPPVPNQLQLSSYTKYWSNTFRNLPRISFVKQEQFKINLKHDKLNLNNHRNNSNFTHPHLSPYTPPGTPSHSAATFLQRCPGLLPSLVELPSTWGGTRAPTLFLGRKQEQKFHTSPQIQDV